MARSSSFSMESLYDRNFYQDQSSGSIRSARIVLSHLFEYYQPDSVVDVGCGIGAWLVAAQELGCSKLIGLDGPWIDTTQLINPSLEFHGVDLEAELPSLGRFDLCMSLEVAEHLSPACSSRFVKNLCNLSDTILFSAAIQKQGGAKHINEQPQSFWASEFEKLGYASMDVIRPAVWSDERIEPWYKQNTLIFSRSSAIQSIFAPLPVMSHYDVVHPDLLTRTVNSLSEIIENKNQRIEHPSTRFLVATLLRWLRLMR